VKYTVKVYSVYLGLKLNIHSQYLSYVYLLSFEVVFSFLSKISRQLKQKQNNNKALKCTDELTARRSALDGAISF